MKWLPAIALLGLVFAVNCMADTPPIVVSYADRPIHAFNQQLIQAQQAQASWSTSPESISQQYAGSDFAVISTKQYQGSTITYSLSHPKPNHPQMMIILSMRQTMKQSWHLQSAWLTWRCKNGQNFGTGRCVIESPQTGPSNK
ncbi:hypothetical protein [Shewanella marina]|uniref:hypothetical protein n=1 Tax=Shewanella marina TaxID=487319 RepID=UPI00046FCFF0|nr:hypothetical protein [Shewanella marina]